MTSAESTRFEFTRARVDAANCAPGKSQALYWDTKQPGLGLRVTSGGKRTFIFEGKLGRQTIRMTIGPASMPIRVPKDKRGNPTGPGADGEALRYLTALRAGLDPRQEKAASIAKAEADRKSARIEQQRRQVTGLEAWADYVTAKQAKWGTLSLRDHITAAQEGGEPRKRSKELTKPGPLRELLSRPLAEINADAIEAWVKAESTHRPAVAARNFRLLRAFLRWCGEHRELSSVAHAEAHAPRRVREHLPAIGVRDDCLQREQLPAWFESVAHIRNRVIGAYLQAVLLTGARREEMAGLRWDDVDFEWGGLTLRDKIEGERVIPLCPYVSSLLAELPRRNEWVFSSPSAKDGRLQEPRIAHDKALIVAGLPHITTHGLRRSFGTLCEWVEMPAGISAQIMGHKPSATAEKHYRRRPLDLLRMWHTKAEAWILEQAGIQQPETAKRTKLRAA